MFCSTFDISTTVKCQLFFYACTLRHVLNPYRSDPIFTGITFRHLGLGNTRKSVSKNVCSGRMFLKCIPALSYKKHCFKEAKYICATRQKHIFILETILPVWQNWKTFEKPRAAYVSGNMFPLFVKALLQFSKEYRTIADKASNQINLFSMS